MGTIKVPRMPGMTHIDAERHAYRIVRRFDPALLQNAERFPVIPFYEFHLVEAYDLNTGVANLPLGVEGYTTPNGTVRVARDVYEDVYEDDPRARQTMVHEGVHGVVHLPILQKLRQTIVSGDAPGLFRREQLAAYEDPEWQANRIAGAVLAPWPAVREVLFGDGHAPRDVVGLGRLMNVFGLSGTAAQHRLRQANRLFELEQRGWRLGA